MDDILNRLGAVESHLSDIRVQVNGLAGLIPHLAAKADIGKLEARMTSEVGRLETKMTSELGRIETQMKSELEPFETKMTDELGALKTEMSGLSAQLPHLATKGDIGHLEASIIRWLVGTAIAIAGLSFAIAKFVH